MDARRLHVRRSNAVDLRAWCAAVHGHDGRTALDDGRRRHVDRCGQPARRRLSLHRSHRSAADHVARTHGRRDLRGCRHMRAVMLLLLVGCGNDAKVAADAPTADTAAADAAGFSTTCTGTCQTTALTAAFQTTRMLDHAYFG